MMSCPAGFPLCLPSGLDSSQILPYDFIDCREREREKQKKTRKEDVRK
jgi:hypothetical protein